MNRINPKDHPDVPNPESMFPSVVIFSDKKSLLIAMQDLDISPHSALIRSQMAG